MTDPVDIRTLLNVGDVFTSKDGVEMIITEKGRRGRNLYAVPSSELEQHTDLICCHDSGTDTAAEIFKLIVESAEENSPPVGQLYREACDLLFRANPSVLRNTIKQLVAGEERAWLKSIYDNNRDIREQLRKEREK